MVRFILGDPKLDLCFCDGFDAGLYDALQADLLDKKSLALLNPYLVFFWDLLNCLPSLIYCVYRLNMWQFSYYFGFHLFSHLAAFKVQNLNANTSLCLLLGQPNLSAVWMYQRAMSVPVDIESPPDFINNLLSINFKCMEVVI